MSQNSNINTNESSDDNFNIFLLNNLSPNSTPINIETFDEISQMGKEKFFSISKKEEEQLNSSTNINNTKSLVNTYEKPINNIENNKQGNNLLNKLSSINQVVSSTSNNNDNEILEQKETINDQENIFLCKKRKLFKVIYRKNFMVFNSGEYDKETRKLINEIVNDIKNCKKKKYSSLKKSESPKKKSKKKRNIKTRKENSDNVMKKIKTRFLKALKKKLTKN